MNSKLIIFFALVNLVFAQYGPPDFGGMQQGGPEGGEEYNMGAAPQPDFEGDNAEVPFESTQEGAYEGGMGGEYAPQGMAPNEQMQPGPYQGYNPEEQMATMHRPKFMPFKK